MAVSLYKPFSHFCYLLLIMMISVKLVATSSVVDEVCRDTPDQAFCTRILGSDPRTQHASLPELERIAIVLAFNSANATRVKIHNLNSSANDPQLGQRLSMCDDCYAAAIDALRYAPDDLNKGRYTSVNLAGAAIQNYATFCENVFTDPPPIASPLINENNYTFNIGEMMVVISNKLSPMRSSLPNSVGPAIDKGVAYGVILLLALGLIHARL